MHTLAICEFYQKNKRLKKLFFINPSKYYLPLWKNEQTPLKLHALPTYKQNEKQFINFTNTL